MIGAVAALKKAHAALVGANAQVSASSAAIGFLDFTGAFRGVGSVWRANRACRDARKAYINLRVVLAQVQE